MAASKVVRVEDVNEVQTEVPSSPIQLLTDGDLQTGKQGAKDVSHEGREEENGGQAERSTENLDAEDEDKVFPLPENWPRIKQLKRPMSCALSASRLPCVRKAVSHLELIQNIIDEWFRRTVEEIKSRASTAQSAQSLQVPVSQKKQLRFRDPSTRSSTRTGISSASRLSSRESSASSLSVTGFGADAAENPEQEETEEDGLDVPYLGAEDVLEETLVLLARLELDRQQTQENFTKETTIVTTLRKKINDLRLKLMRLMPHLVEKEHEACTADMNELLWHVTYVSRTLAKSQERKDIAEVLNERLKEDISFVKQHVPLVQEKLALELAAMDKIKKAQVETNQELMTTKQRQAKTEQKSTEAMNKAETERGHIRRELDIVRDNLTHISEELSTAKMTFNSYVHQVNDMNTTLVDNAQELKVLEVKNANAKAAEEMQATKVRALHSKIAEAEFEYQRLSNENEQAAEELKILKSRNAKKLAEWVSSSKALESKFRVVSLKNQDLTMVIEDTQTKINECEQQKIKDEKNLQRIAREVERVGTMMHATTEEHTKVSQINHHIRSQLHAEQEKAFRSEESLKNMVETLRRQVKEEMHTRTVLQARIVSDTTEIEKTRVESGKKKEKAGKVVSDVDSAVAVVLEKVEKLRAQKQTKDKEMADLKQSIEELKSKHTATKQQFTERVTDINPHFLELKKEVSKLDKQLESMEWKTDMMTKKIEEMDAAQNMMDKVSGKTTSAIENLTTELEELKVQLETTSKLLEDLRQQYSSVQDRMKDGDYHHSRFLGERNKVLFSQEAEKKQCLEKNKDLASRYRQLVNDYFVMKEKVLHSFDERLKLESTISDVKQLKSLQCKLHGALAEYFKLSGLYNEGELVRLEQESSENGMRVGQLQSDMEEALALITHFLQSEMDGTRAREMAWEAVRRMSQVPEGLAPQGAASAVAS